MENKLITYTPNPEAPINLDLTSYRRPEANRGIIKFAWMYAICGGICILFLVFKQYIAFVQNYFVLLEAMAAILLFMAGKCYFAYARDYNRFLRWDCTAARIIRVTEHETGSHTFIDLEFTPENGSEPIKFTEEIHAPLLTAIKELGINALPVLYQPSRCYTGRTYYVDLRFCRDGLDTSNLTKKS